MHHPLHYARTLVRRAAACALLSPLVQAALWLAAASPAMAYGRLIPVLTQVPGPTASSPPRPLSSTISVAVLRDTVLVSDKEHHRIFKVSLADGSMVPWVGTGVAGNHLDPSSALNTQLTLPGCLCVRRNGTVLVVDEGNHRILELRPGAEGAPPTAAVFAGTGVHGNNFDPGSPLNCSLPYSVGQMIESPDGSVLVALPYRGEVWRIHEGAVNKILDLPPPPSPSVGVVRRYPSGLMERDDHSVAITDREGLVALVDAHGANLLDRPENADFKKKFEFLRVTCAFSWARGQDHSLLAAAIDRLDALFLLRGEGVTMLAGNSGNWIPSLLPPPDPSYYPGTDYVGFGDSNFGLQVLKDGSILLPSARGAMLLSPDDALQTTLEHLVESGKAAIDGQNPEDIRAAEQDLVDLCASTLGRLRSVAMATRNRPNDLNLQGRRLPTELGKLVNQFAENPVDAFRAQAALRELRDYKRNKGTSHTGDSSSSRSGSSKSH